MLAAIAFSLFLITESLKEHTVAVKRINAPNKFIDTWDEALHKVELAGETINIYNIKGDSLALNKFDAAKIDINQQIKLLYTLADTSNRRAAYVDSLYDIIDKRLELYIIRAYTVDANKDMASFDKTAKKLLDNENKNRIKAEAKQSIEQPAEKTSDNKQTEPQNNNFWKRIFNKKKKENPKSTEVVEPQVSPSTDTVKQFADTKPVAKILHNLRVAEKQVKEQALKDMLSLIAEEQNTDTRLYNLTRGMEKAEIKVTDATIIAASTLLDSSTRTIVMWLGIGAFLFLTLFCWLIVRDIMRSNKLNKQLDQARINAEALAKAREDFASNMSHEIRTPLNALVGFSEQLANTNLDAKQHTMANALLRSSRHLLSVINPVLDYSKLIAGKTVLEVAPFSLAEVFEDVKLLYSQQAEAKGLTITTKIAPGIPVNLLGDVVKLRQVLFNLVSNAIKFTHKGGVELACVAGNINDKEIKLNFVVSDTGIGIAKDKIEAIFDEFTQADNSITRHYGGTGLGLNIVKRMVELQGGTIEVQSTVGEGSVFTVGLTYEINTSPQANNPNTELAEDSIVKGKKIVVCDDEEINRMLLTHILTNHGAIVTEADSAQQMLTVIEEVRPDLLITDLQMPGMDGLEAFRILRNLPDKELAATKVLAITGNVKPGKKEMCIELGMNGFLSKPFVEAQLFAALNAVLK